MKMIGLIKMMKNIYNNFDKYHLHQFHHLHLRPALMLHAQPITKNTTTAIPAHISTRIAVKMSMLLQTSVYAGSPTPAAASSFAAMCVFGTAPMIWSTTLPFLKISNEGIERIPYCIATRWLLSTSSFPIFALPS